MSKPILLHLGDDIKWNQSLYSQLEETFNIMRSYSMNRAEFKQALQQKRFGDFVAIYRPFWNTGGEMGNWDDELISLLPQSCKIYASAGAGFDWVDTQGLAKRGIVYCNAASACTESVADAAIWLILDTFRNFAWSSTSARSADPTKFKDAHQNIAAKTQNPRGFTLGIVGLGRIGYRIAEKAYLAFDMKIIYYDIKRMPEEVESTIKARFFERMDDMLAEADCVLLATPFVSEKVMNAERFAKMKKGSRFVNIARGKLVDEDSLVAALDSGHIASAGLDVHFDEPNVNAKLAKMSNVEMLSHTAGASLDSHKGFETLGMENILSFVKTGKALTPVNLQWIKPSKL